MNREDIIAMARKAGFSEAVTRMVLHTYDLGVEAGAAAEREACARVCLDMQNGWASDDHLQCAFAIRARGRS